MPATRNTDPVVTALKGRLGAAVRDGNKEAAARYRQELADIVVTAEAEKIAARFPDMSPEKREQVRALLGGA